MLLLCPNAGRYKLVLRFFSSIKFPVHMWNQRPKLTPKMAILIPFPFYMIIWILHTTTMYVFHSVSLAYLVLALSPGHRGIGVYQVPLRAGGHCGASRVQSIPVCQSSISTSTPCLWKQKFYTMTANSLQSSPQTLNLKC